MKRAILLLLFSACGEPYSNEDLRFVHSVPEPDEVMIELPNDGMAATMVATYYLQMVAASEGVNRAIFEPLGTVNDISRLPPTRREDDVRSWGPIQTSTSVAFTLYMARTATTGIRVPTSTSTIVAIEERFDFVLYGHVLGDPEPIAVLSGGFASTQDDGRGIGGIQVDLDAYARLDRSATEVGQYSGAYDNRDGQSLVFYHLAPDGGTSWHHFERHDGAVDFAFFQQADIYMPAGVVTPMLENVTMLGRWRPDNRGRADLRYDGGDLGGSAIGSECWDGQFRRVYFAATSPELGASEGSVDNCAPDLKEPLFFRR